MEIKIKLKGRNIPEAVYSYYIEKKNIWDKLSHMLSDLCADKIAIITDQNVYSLYGKYLKNDIKPNCPISLLVLPPGEAMKSFETMQSVIQFLLKDGFSKKSVLVCFGGGCIGNLGIVVSSNYFRGIRHVQIPTSLMAIADSVIGHKGAINFCNVKNIFGTYFPPQFIYTDLSFLKTLPSRELLNGLAEVLKHGFVHSPDLLYKASKLNAENLAKTHLDIWEMVVVKCIHSKLQLLTNDLEEENEASLLQFGHTVGHAIEMVDPSLLHGEAIATGMVIESEIGCNAGFSIKSDLPKEIETILSSFNLPTRLPPTANVNEIISVMGFDKKRLNGHSYYVLLEDIGMPIKNESGGFLHKIPMANIKEVLCQQINGHTDKISETPIPIHMPYLNSNEKIGVEKVLESALVSPGIETDLFEQDINNYLDQGVVATCNGTSSLILALHLCNIGPGDEVILPSYGFVAPLTAILRVGATPIFCDISTNNLGIDPDAVIMRITEKTKAVICIHMYGLISSVNLIAKICKTRGIFFIEDCAQGFGGEYEGRKIGTFGDIGIFSFGGTKNITSGEGGAITTPNKKFLRQAQALIDHGMFQQDKSEMTGYNFKLSNVNASIGRKQMQKLPEIIARKKKIVEAYIQTFQDTDHFRLFLPISRKSKPVYNVFPVQLTHQHLSLETVKNYFLKHNISIKLRYRVPLFEQPIVSNLNISGLFPVTEKIVNTLFALPCHPSITQDELERILSVVNQLKSEINE
jgi:perosamine synthetase